MRNKINRKFLSAIPAILGLITAQGQNVQTPAQPGINVEYMDKDVKASNDFFRYVNGTWLDKTEIPSDRTRWGSFDELRQ
jgi:putative endopeptidase